MVPAEIHGYLRQHGIGYRVREHPFAIDAAHLAAAQHVSGWRLAKPVIVKVDGERAMVVIRGPDRVDLQGLSEAMGGGAVELCPESEFATLFPGCELGAEPPLGGLYGLPVYLDRSVSSGPSPPSGRMIVFRAGTHIETIELAYPDYIGLEQPTLVEVARPWQPPPSRERAFEPEEGLPVG